MATPANDFLSLLFCYKKNGNYVNFPLFNDVGANQIVYIRAISAPDQNGNLIPSYMLVVQDPKSLNFDILWCTVANFQSSLATFQGYLNSISYTNSFTLYTGLLSIGAFEVIGDLNGSIVINDLWTRGRVFDGNNTTTIYLNIQTDLIYQQIKVAGDATTSGIYYYNYLPY